MRKLTQLLSVTFAVLFALGLLAAVCYGIYLWLGVYAAIRYALFNIVVGTWLGIELVRSRCSYD
jgi:hypothetical protein